jgi:hypothetical protein
MANKPDYLLIQWLEQADKWVYVFEQSHLTREAVRLLETGSFSDIRITLDEQALKTSDKTEAAQLWMKLALMAARVGELEEAEKFLQKVTQDKKRDQHYIGVATWMNVCLVWNRGEPDMAFPMWVAARQAFTKAKEDRPLTPDKRAWYDDKIRLMEEAMNQAKKRGSLPPLLSEAPISIQDASNIQPDIPDPALLDRLDDSRREERLAAVQELSHFAISSLAVRKLLRGKLVDPDPGVRIAAGKALLPVLTGDQSARKDFRNRLDPTQETDPVVRAAFARFLKDQTNVPWVRSDLVKRLSDDSPEVRLAAVETLAGLAPTSPAVKTALQKVANDSDPQVQSAARKALGLAEPSAAERITQQLLSPDALDKAAASDQPLTALDQDRLGFTPYVLGLKEFIASESTGTPLTIGVDGTWGSGKSSLMRMLQGQLDPPPGSQDARTLQSDRRAWRQAYWRELPRLAWAKFTLWLYLGTNPDDPAQHPDWVKTIQAGMSYDPIIHEKKDIEAWEDPKAKRWAETRRRTFPMRPAHPTAWFNAWKFDQEEQVWAALAVEVTNQLKARYGWLERLAFWLGLNWRRFKPLEAAWMVVRKILVPALLIIAFLLYMNLANSGDNPLPWPLDKLKLEKFYGYLLLLGAVVVGYINVSKILKDPFQINIKELTRAPDYQGKIGFIGQFQADFKLIVEQATRPRFGWRQSKLIIFIDDLDRCEPPKSANIVEAINIFLDSPQCIFVLGMDMRAVVASIEIKYKDVFARMQQQEQSLVSPGRIFLDKIIQVPIHLPRPGDQAILYLVKEVTQPHKRPLIAPPKRLLLVPVASGGTEEREPPSGVVSPPETSGVPPDQKGDPSPKVAVQVLPDVASISRSDIQSAIEQGSRLLSDNPRQVKRFINLFRLNVYIADQNKILERRGAQGLDLAILATWVAFSLRYTEAVQSLAVETNTEKLAEYLSLLAQNIVETKEGVLFQVKNYDEQVAELKVKRDQVKDLRSHWRQLPWETWMQESDFCQAVIKLEGIWILPGKGQEDWLVRLLRLSKVAG